MWHDYPIVMLFIIKLKLRTFGYISASGDNNNWEESVDMLTDAWGDT